jgi:hypothetical protein
VGEIPFDDVDQTPTSPTSEAWNTDHTGADHAVTPERSFTTTCQPLQVPVADGGYLTLSEVGLATVAKVDENTDRYACTLVTWIAAGDGIPRPDLEKANRNFHRERRRRTLRPKANRFRQDQPCGCYVCHQHCREARRGSVGFAGRVRDGGRSTN